MSAFSVATVGQKTGFSALERLLSVGRHTVHNEPLAVVMCKQFGVEAQTDWPIAALSWLGEGGDPAHDYWLHADPVHLTLQRDCFSLSAPVPLPLDVHESQALMADLNRHFAQDGLQFQLGHMQSRQVAQWYLRLSTPPDLRTWLPECAVGRDIRLYMPEGKDAANWRRLGNEIQMLLHDHAVNQAREARGELPVNSVWFSAGGVLPGKLEAGQQTVFSNSSLLTGLALAADLPTFALPENMQALLGRATENVAMALEDFEQAEQNWFAPLRDALCRRIVRRVDFYFAVRDQVLVVQVHWYDLFKLWRRPKSLKTYF